MKLVPLYLLFFLFTLQIYAQELAYHKVFFENSLMEQSWYQSKVNYHSPSFVLNIQNKLPVENGEAFTPGNSLVLSYDSSPQGSWEVSLEFPEWRGKDHFKQAKYLSLWIYVRSETEAKNLPQLAVRKEDSISKFQMMSKFVQDLQNEKWIQVKLPLENFGTNFTNSEEITSILLKQANGDSGRHEILIDQVELLSEEKSDKKITAVQLNSAKSYERHVDLSWDKLDPDLVRYVKIYRSQDGSEYKPVGVQNTQYFSMYTDFTGTPDETYKYKISALGHDYSESALSDEIEVSTRSMTDEELLTMVQKASFNYYWEGAETNSGLALENIPGRKNMIASGASGFGLMALIVGAERNFITREDFLSRMEKIVTFLEKSERFHGAYSHFIDGPTGKVEPFFGTKDNGADLVETSFLMQGLLTVRQYLAEDDSRELELRNKITQIWEAVEWDWFKQPGNSDYLTWHWSPDQEWVIDHQLIGWNETMITYFLAIASPTHSIDAEMYYSGWASQGIEAKEYRSNWGETSAGSNYINEQDYYGIPLKVGVGVGGPLFFVHYSYLGLNPHEMQDKYVNYFENNKDIVLINYRYSCENPGSYEGYGRNSWGLTASDGPEGYKAREAKPSQDDGTLAPTGAIASFPYTPEKSMDALKHFYRNNGYFLWGEYGFRDAFNLSEDWVANIYMGLNQAPMVVMIENQRTGLLWDLFMKNEEVRAALQKIKSRN